MTPEVIDWLLDGAPAIRWQVLRDPVGASPSDVAAEHSRVEREGWVARLLALEDPDGLWDGGACFPGSYKGGEPGQPWTATMHTLQRLQICGLDPGRVHFDIEEGIGAPSRSNTLRSIRVLQWWEHVR